jgi:hypothetical protein
MGLGIITVLAGRWKNRLLTILKPITTSHTLPFMEREEAPLLEGEEACVEVSTRKALLHLPHLTVPGRFSTLFA